MANTPEFAVESGRLLCSREEDQKMARPNYMRMHPTAKYHNEIIEEIQRKNAWKTSPEHRAYVQRRAECRRRNLATVLRMILVMAALFILILLLLGLAIFPQGKGGAI